MLNKNEFVNKQQTYKIKLKKKLLLLVKFRKKVGVVNVYILN